LEACKLSATPEAYLVIDSNVALHQARAPTRRSGARARSRAIGLCVCAPWRVVRQHPLTSLSRAGATQLDFLEHSRVNDVVVLGIVLEEVRAPACARAGSRRVVTCADAQSSRAAPQVRKRNLSAYTRLRTLCAAPSRRVFVFANEHHRDTYCLAEPGESPNDRNDRAIRVATAWYARVCPGARVVLLTADAGNRAKARAEGIEVRPHTHTPRAML
jgi:hypothetical protein